MYFEYFLTKGQIAVLLKEVIQWVGTSGIPADAVHLPGKERGRERQGNTGNAYFYTFVERGKGEEPSLSTLVVYCSALCLQCRMGCGGGSQLGFIFQLDGTSLQRCDSFERQREIYRTQGNGCTGA